jgi:hypothetical protein
LTGGRRCRKRSHRKALTLLLEPISCPSEMAQIQFPPLSRQHLSPSQEPQAGHASQNVRQTRFKEN